MKSVLTFLILSFITVSSGRTLMEGECESPDDCQPGECCVLGMQRYAIPECRRLATLGEDCIEDAEPQDRMLYYPNNEFRWVLQLHTLMCPCEGNYVCHKNKCSNPFNWK